jgi:glycine betaine transporter
VTTALFSMFDRLPLSDILGFTAIFLIFIFLVTSADSATYVLGMLTSSGSLDPSIRRKLVWGAFLGALAAALILTGNVFALRGVVIGGAFPFVLILVLQVAALLKSLRKDRNAEGEDA